MTDAADEQEVVRNFVGLENLKFATDIYNRVSTTDRDAARLFIDSANFGYLNETVPDDEYNARVYTILEDLLTNDDRVRPAILAALKQLNIKDNKEIDSELEESSEGEDAEAEAKDQDDKDYKPGAGKSADKAKDKKQTKSEEVKVSQKTEPSKSERQGGEEKVDAAAKAVDKELLNFKKSFPLVKIKKYGTLYLVKDIDDDTQEPTKYTAAELQEDLQSNPILAQEEAARGESIQHGNYKIELGWNFVHVLLSHNSQVELQIIMASRAFFQAVADVTEKEDWRKEEPDAVTRLVIQGRSAVKLYEDAMTAEFKTLVKCVQMYLEFEYVLSRLDVGMSEGNAEGIACRDYISSKVQTTGVNRARLKEFSIRAMWNKPIKDMSRNDAEWVRCHTIYRWMYNLGHRLFNITRGLGGLGWLLLVPKGWRNKLTNLPPSWCETFRDVAKDHPRLQAIGKSLTEEVMAPLEAGHDPRVLAFQIAQRDVPSKEFTWEELLDVIPVTQAGENELVKPKAPGFIEEEEIIDSPYKTVRNMANATAQDIGQDIDFTVDGDMEEDEGMEVD